MTMKKKTLAILMVLAVVCCSAIIMVCLGGHSENVSSTTETAKPETLEVTEAGYADYHGRTTTSIFGLWLSPELDPYESTDYYLHDNLVPGSCWAENLPFRIYTQERVYELDSYVPKAIEYGYAWLNLKELDEDGNVLSESPFKYSPSGHAKLRYDASAQTVALID